MNESVLGATEVAFELRSPTQVASELAVARSTLRDWSSLAAPLLSDSARTAPRMYTLADLEVLRNVSARLDDGAFREQLAEEYGATSYLRRLYIGRYRDAKLERDRLRKHTRRFLTEVASLQAKNRELSSLAKCLESELTKANRLATQLHTDLENYRMPLLRRIDQEIANRQTERREYTRDLMNLQTELTASRRRELSTVIRICPVAAVKTAHRRP